MHRETWVEVNFDAMRDNMRALTSKISPVEVCAVVKADGYGHGGPVSAFAALAGGAARLAVATVDEGIELRSAGISAPVLVLSEPANIEAATALSTHRLTSAVYTLEGLNLIKRGADRGMRSPVAVHMKVDTGLHRLGASPDGVLALAQAAAQMPEIRAEGLFTHFAAASVFDKEFTAEQRRRFDVVIEMMRTAGLLPPLVHACNSAGITLALGRNDTVARSGAVLYGIAPTRAVRLPVEVKPALTFKSRVSFVRTMPAGEALGYGRNHVVDDDCNVAIVPAGYADGVPRRLGTAGGTVLINGVQRPIIGPVSMDQMTVDCGPDPVKKGDEVIIIGSQGDEHISALDWAEMLESWPSEVFTGITKRVPRIIVDSSGEIDLTAPLAEQLAAS